MFPKSKASGSTPSVLLSNPLNNLYDVGEQSATAGPENAWRIYDGYSKADKKEVSIFLFDKRSVEKICKPKRKEMVTDILRKGARKMERISHPKVLQAYKVEECTDTLAFASEPVLASLANVLTYKEASNLDQTSSNTARHASSATGHRTTFTKNYELLDIEIKYGLLQIAEALLYLHGNCKILHRNVCPASIIITKRGTWKLSGLEFIVEIGSDDALVDIPPWTNRAPKMTQPNLDYTAPEIQQKKQGSFYSDMYSFGMTICAIFNQGRPLIQANHSCSEYLKQIENLDDQVAVMLPLIPLPLREAVSHLLHNEPEQRPTVQTLLQIKYFQDPPVHALQFLDVSKMKTVLQKEHFYTVILKEILPYIPKKLWYQHIWTYLETELESQQVQSAVLQPVLYIVQNSTQHEYDYIIFPALSALFAGPKSIQGTVTLLENLHLILMKTSGRNREQEVLRLLYDSFENSTMQVQTAVFVATANVMTDYIKDDEAIRKIILPKLLQAFEQNSVDARVLLNVIPCMLNRLEKKKIVDSILPLLLNAKLEDPEIIVRVVKIYRILLTNKMYGLTVNWMATQAMPSLLPQTINPALSLEQFGILVTVLQEMLSHIERNQRNQLSLNNLTLSSSERHWSLRHQCSTDNMHAPPFNIPNLRVEQRKTSSAEDMARKASTGSISMTASAENMARKNSVSAVMDWFSPSRDDGNFLSLAKTTYRRLSDNTLATPKIRVVQSCVSSPGGSPGGGLPFRRHSSTGSQDRRGSHINLSPPTCGELPVTSSSVPYLHSSSMNSIRGSRRPSVSSTSSQQGAGFLQQVSSSMYQFLSRQFDARTMRTPR
ncbi:SCY1-like protein bma isoform X2 [Halictus rubicundus]|uniref:SCY1-like protein bma isoform X2 n=1 Tax=Halictus rubicundus TaxID=77578 RepID=UPI0040367EC4